MKQLDTALNTKNGENRSLKEICIFVYCGQVGGYLEADHIKPFSLYPELRFELSNGRTYCKPCHKIIGWSLFRESNPKIPMEATLVL